MSNENIRILRLAITPLTKNVLQTHFLNVPFDPHRTLLTKNLSLHSD